MSLMQMNNISFLTYCALGITGVILAVATVYETSDDKSTSAAAEEEPFEVYRQEESTEPTPKTEESGDSSGLFDVSPVNTNASQENSLFGTEAKQGAENGRIGGKKNKRRTKKHGGGIKKSGKTKRRKNKQKKSKKQ